MQGVMLSTALDNACAAMMPACAYPDRVNVDFCKATVDYALDGPKSNVQDVNVVDRNANKISGWKAKCKSSGSIRTFTITNRVLQSTSLLLPKQRTHLAYSGGSRTATATLPT
jgi:hypothetical protein